MKLEAQQNTAGPIRPRRSSKTARLGKLRTLDPYAQAKSIQENIGIHAPMPPTHSIAR
jgi:hypothetical protein